MEKSNATDHIKYLSDRLKYVNISLPVELVKKLDATLRLPKKARMDGKDTVGITHQFTKVVLCCGFPTAERLKPHYKMAHS